jgi:hypothetical protein
VQAGPRRPSHKDAWTKIDLMTQRAAAGGAQQPAQKAGEIFSVSVFRPCSDHASDLAGGGKGAKSECRVYSNCRGLTLGGILRSSWHCADG